MNEDKLKFDYEICVKEGYTEEAKKIVAELTARGRSSILKNSPPIQKSVEEVNTDYIKKYAKECAPSIGDLYTMLQLHNQNLPATDVDKFKNDLKANFGSFDKMIKAYFSALLLGLVDLFTARVYMETIEDKLIRLDITRHALKPVADYIAENDAFYASILKKLADNSAYNAKA